MGKLALKTLLISLILTVLGLASAHAASQEGGDLRPWKWMKSSCQNCPIIFEPKHEDLQSKKVRAFIRALEDSKFEIVELYGADPQEYNLLAHMAIGILGRESKFFKSWRYFAKEEMQWGVSLIKTLRVYLSDEETVSSNSRGPTQIKDVPALIAEHYGITPDTLSQPGNAAKATMGFLIEALRELKQRAKNNNLEFVKKETYADYLPYIYFGASKQLTNRTATPDKNLYIKAMKGYMAWVQIWEFVPANQRLF